MTEQTPKRAPLTRDRVLSAGVAFADESGLALLSMRKLAATLNVEAMSLYNHVANKDDLIDGMLDQVAADLGRPRSGKRWKQSLAEATLMSRETLLAHPWAAALFLSRATRGPNRVAHANAVVGCLTSAGLGPSTIARAMATLDSFLFGAVLQELNAPDAAALSDASDGKKTKHLDRLSEALSKKKRKATDFEFGLSLILDGLEGAGKPAKSAKPGKTK